MQNRKIDGGKPFDWGRTSDDYAKYRDIYPPIFYKKILDLGLCISGQKVLDLGTGTGVLPRHLYSAGAHFTGVDISENQILQARRLAQDGGMDIEFIVSPAEDLAFSPNTFDVVTACQCFFYFDSARERESKDAPFPSPLKPKIFSHSPIPSPLTCASPSPGKAGMAELKHVAVLAPPFLQKRSPTLKKNILPCSTASHPLLLKFSTMPLWQY